MSKNIEKIDAVAKPGGTSTQGQAYARLEYYMVDHPQQKKWKKVPGYVPGATEAEALETAKVIANELDGLTIKEMSRAAKKMIADKRLINIGGQYIK